MKILRLRGGIDAEMEAHCVMWMDPIHKSKWHLVENAVNQPQKPVYVVTVLSIAAGHVKTRTGARTTKLGAGVLKPALS